MWGALLVLGGLLPLCSGHSGPRGVGCRVVNQMADCSHQNLLQIPDDLPSNLTSLDVSHNRLRDLSAAVLGRYGGLRLLRAGYNNVRSLEAGLCLALPQLTQLHVQHNEIYILREQDLLHCSKLMELNLTSNRLKLKGEPFRPLQNLTSLDVSVNGLISAQLGIQPQLWSLEQLSLSGNKISTLQTEDFSWLNQSSVRVLRMAALPLKLLKPGCLKPLRGLKELVLDRSKLGPDLVEQLSQELAGSRIRWLSLQNIKLDSVTNTTFKGLQDTNLNSMDLSYNGMSSITSGSFRYLHTLEDLSLQRNSFSHLTKDTFTGLGNLKSLKLQGALVNNALIDDYTFQPLKLLESLWLDETKLHNLSAHTFSGLSSLQNLSLSWSLAGLSTVTSSTFASLADSPLRMLNLTAANIKLLHDDAFSGLRNLTRLFLTDNFISQVLTGAEFRGLASIQELCLSYNRQKIQLRPLSFVNVPTLKTLLLRRTLLGQLDFETSPFLPLQELLLLDLSNNNIAIINANLLSSLGQLKVLKLQHNNLADMWKSVTPKGPTFFLQGLENLTVLELDYNGLDEIPTHAFSSLQQLQDLSLTGNVLEFLHAGAFSDLVSLRSLDLRKNLITSVPQAVFQPVLRNLAVLRLGQNPFDCTCDSIFWFVSWLNATNTSVPLRESAYICNTPPAYFNKSVTQFNVLSCKDLTPFQALFVLSSTVVLVLMGTALLLRFQGWRIQFYWKVVVSRTLGFREVDRGEKRFLFDAYVIHAPEDRKWVDRHLLPLEMEENFGFCLEDRDFTPGTSRLESIVEKMRQSRKIVFIVTETLLKDPWCTLYKVHHAMHQLIEDSRDSVVLVFLEDVPDHRLSRALLLRRGMLRRSCLLCWPPERARRPAFRLSLKGALCSTNRTHKS
ncbi:toll-like receptor 3 isoform X2 [Brienomyrus brachyistius]|nr:toll-like receptor 3 isoform X2 [Brienomyrus brachyistius]XP_048852234.1 toll-like receptor 3 isoform X2 [Brienomyrus brachyistius]